MKASLICLILESSCSAAVLQSGARCVGVGLGAGVGGEAGAEGNRLWGMVDDIGLVGVCIGRGVVRDIVDRFRLRDAGEGYMLVGPFTMAGDTMRSPSLSRR